MDPAWIALISTIAGGVSLKVLEHWLGRSKVKIDDATTIRSELRLTVTDQRAEIAALEKDVDKWREEYFDLKEKYIALQTQLTLTLNQIKDSQSS